MKHRHYIYISIDAERAFDKTEHPFTITSLNKMGMEEKYISLKNAIYDKLRATNIPNGKQLKGLHLKSQPG